MSICKYTLGPVYLSRIGCPSLIGAKLYIVDLINGNGVRIKKPGRHKIKHGDRLMVRDAITGVEFWVDPDALCMRQL